MQKIIIKDDCAKCDPGKYCQEEGLTEPSGDCYGGYYCELGAINPDNPVTDDTSGPCPTGYRCPNGTSQPLSCGVGYYNNLPAQTECFICPDGYVCLTN